MKQLKVLILEDNADAAAYLDILLRKLGCTSITITDTVAAAVAAFEADKPDICLVDIYLGEQPEGILFAETINEQPPEDRRPFIFLTSAADQTTFRLARFTSPYNYLLKPYNPLELQYAIELAIAKFKQETVAVQQTVTPIADTLFIKKGNLLQRIAYDDIRYIEVDGKYSKVICGSDKFVIQQSLKELQSQLPPEQFSRVHRNYIVNVKEVTKINVFNNEIFFKDGTSLFFSRRYIDAFLHAFKIFK